MKRNTLLILMLSYADLAGASCGGAFCNLSTDWGVQGMSSQPGVRLDVRAEFISLDELRRGSNHANATGEVGEHDEIRTINRNVLTTIDWNINPDWGVSFKIPLIDRAHQHIFNAEEGAELEKWDFSGLGDIQALGRYRYYHDNIRNAGVLFGVKLPTGSIHEHNAEEDAERTLQPGTGSVDSVLGAYYNHHMGNMAWFAQGTWQQTLHERDHFRPGSKLSADLGLSYQVAPSLSVLMQVNLLHKAKDSGVNAEPADSGGTSLNLSPGFSYHFNGETQLYGFIQTPIYQYVHGAQLTADWSVALGMSTFF